MPSGWYAIEGRMPDGRRCERGLGRPDIAVDHAQLVRDTLMVIGYTDETGA
jgi:hypothetical protein